MALLIAPEAPKSRARTPPVALLIAPEAPERKPGPAAEVQRVSRPDHHSLSLNSPEESQCVCVCVCSYVGLGNRGVRSCKLL